MNQTPPPKTATLNLMRFSVLSLFLCITLPLFAQVQSYAPETNIPLRLPPEPLTTTTPQVKPADAMTIQVHVSHASLANEGAGKPVFLRAARARGPFEPTAPKPKFEWTALSDSQGIATFPAIPKNLAEQGLRLHAIVSHGGIVFDSPPEIPSANRIIPLKIYERSVNLNKIVISNLRSLVEIWESYLVFRQTYSIVNRSEFAIDTTMLPGKQFEKGLPITVPIKAQGIRAFGSGSNLVVNSTIYWRGVLLPGRTAQIQVHYSIPVKTQTYVYKQKMDYKTENVEVILPLQTKFKKVPRLSNLQLFPPGFKETERGGGIFGLRADIDFIGARGLEVEAGKEYTFQLKGLPFHRPMVPYYVLLVGITCAIFAFFFTTKVSAQRPSSKEIASTLEGEKRTLLDELILLDQERRDKTITQSEYENETFITRERLALILKKMSANDA